MATGKIKKDIYRRLLWTNPHPSYWDASNENNTDNDIFLSSDDYDYLEFECPVTGATGECLHCHKITRLQTVAFTITIPNAAISGINNNFMMGREYTIISKTHFKVTSGFIIRWGQTGVTTNASFAVPVNIYGVKYS